MDRAWQRRKRNESSKKRQRKGTKRIWVEEKNGGVGGNRFSRKIDSKERGKRNINIGRKMKQRAKKGRKGFGFGGNLGSTKASEKNCVWLREKRT